MEGKAKESVEKMSLEEKKLQLAALQKELGEREKPEKFKKEFDNEDVKRWGMALKARAGGTAGMQLGKGGPPTPTKWEAFATAPIDVE